MIQHLVDVSRSLSRLHLPIETGIDRVERAYIARIAQHHPSALAIGKFGSEYLILPLGDFSSIRSADLVGQSTLLIDRMRRKLSPEQRRAKSYLRRHFGLMGSYRFGQELTKIKDLDIAFWSIGHSRVLLKDIERLRQKGWTVRIMVHDLIPLTHSALTRDGTNARFQNFLGLAKDAADQFICVSEDTKTHLRPYIIHQDICVAAPGVDLEIGPREVDPSSPFFLVVGTIEPRKNIGFLLDLWEIFADQNKDANLVFVGQKGWDEVAAKRIEQLSKTGRVILKENCDDAELTKLYQKCSAVLFPSLAEGFGIPFFEAAHAQAPIIASDLPVFREYAGPTARLLDPLNADAWLDALHKPQDFIMDVTVPSWDAHFQKVGL